MSRAYWLDLFTGKTWEEFKKQGANISGFRHRRRRIAKTIKPGDFIWADVDFCLGNDITAPLAIDEFRRLGKSRVFNPEKIIAAIQDQGVTSMFASPALLNRVGGYGKKKAIKLPSLKRVISAGAPVSPDNIEHLFISTQYPCHPVVNKAIVEREMICPLNLQEVFRR